MNYNNCKFVSSEGIMRSCDIQIESIDDLSIFINNKNDKKLLTVYVHVNFIKELKKIIDLIEYDFILVSGSGDYTNPTDFFNNNDEFLQFINNNKIIKWYSQNCLISHHKLIKIPIGLDYHTLSKTSNYWGEQKSQIDQENDLITICNQNVPFWERQLKCYSNFHFVDYSNKFGYTRQYVINTIPRKLVYYEPNKINRINTWINQSKFTFVISPFGNGLDCHRTWEALILGCIVIVKTSPLDCLYVDLPVLILNEWSDLNEDILNKTVIEFKCKNFDYNKLKLDYYMYKIKNSEKL
jgi:hypothetical protein